MKYNEFETILSQIQEYAKCGLVHNGNDHTLSVIWAQRIKDFVDLQHVNCPDPDKKEIFTCTLKTRLRMEKDIPRERWGWWIDTCPGQTLKLRRATDQDLKRCTLNENDTRTASDFMCEIGERGSLVSKEAIEYVQMPITTI